MEVKAKLRWSASENAPQALECGGADTAFTLRSCVMRVGLTCDADASPPPKPKRRLHPFGIAPPHSKALRAALTARSIGWHQVSGGLKTLLTELKAKLK